MEFTIIFPQQITIKLICFNESKYKHGVLNTSSRFNKQQVKKKIIKPSKETHWCIWALAQLIYI